MNNDDRLQGNKVPFQHDEVRLHPYNPVDR